MGGCAEERAERPLELDEHPSGGELHRGKPEVDEAVRDESEVEVGREGFRERRDVGVTAALERGLPVQGAFQMEVGQDGALRERVSSLAVRLKNDLRVRGLSALGGAVSLLGSNFALPWSACLAVPAPAGELAEDAGWGWRVADAE